MARPSGKLFEESSFRFGPNFLRDHAGFIMTDPRVAVVELIANAYDAGANEVRIKWPEEVSETFEITDNGTGMTEEQFDARWKTLSYNRRDEQGEKAEFPADSRAKRKDRLAFGQTGKGRHGAFCFADAYEIETWRDGSALKAIVSITNAETEPFHCEASEASPRSGHGTAIRAKVSRAVLPVDAVREAVGSKFLVDPDFKIIVNGQELRLVGLENVVTSELEIPGHGTVTIHQVDGASEDRTTGLRGITYWVNRRMVGQPSWRGLDGKGSILDGRTAPAKRFSFVVEADLLKEEVKSDWSDFHPSKRVQEVTGAVREAVIDRLDSLLSASRKERKLEALEAHRKALKGLPPMSRRVVGQFIDQALQKCPSLSQGDLSRTVEILARLEQARSGYDLLERLVACSPDDLDTWNSLMSEWSAQDAEIVLGELGRRLKLIEDIQRLVHDAKADELHDLQPLFERGLWMFGPEYEAVDFRSNRSMATVIRSFFGLSDADASQRRADFVALPEASIAPYSADDYDDQGEALGYRKVLVVELKKGGFLVRQKEIDQARDYCKELRTAKKVQPTTHVVAYVLGAKIESGVEVTRLGEGDLTKIIPLDYDQLLSRAHARTFHLYSKIKAAKPEANADPEVEAIVNAGQTELYDGIRAL